MEAVGRRGTLWAGSNHGISAAARWNSDRVWALRRFLSVLVRRRCDRTAIPGARRAVHDSCDGTGVFVLVGQALRPLGARSADRHLNPARVGAVDRGPVLPAR